MKEPRARAERSGARTLAFEILLRVERSDAYASVLLDRREGSLADPREAALLHELVLGVLRRRAVLDHAIAAASSREPERIDPEVRVALRIGAYGLFYLDRVPDFAAVSSAVDLVRRGRASRAAGFVNGVLRNLARQGRALLPAPAKKGDLPALALAGSHPVWWVRRVAARLGWSATAGLLERNNAPAGAVLRANPLRLGAEQLQERLAGEGLAAERCAFVSEALRVRSGRLGRCKALAAGDAWVQDEAAQLVTCLFGPRLGPRVADLCAAPGGKTLQIASRLAEGGLVVAIDRHLGRLRRLAGNVRRAGAGNVLPLQADASAPSLPLRGGFHQVLLDAPCSGSGTLRRHPELRWRLREEDLKLLAARQQRLLRNAATLVAAGGSLVYAVCSMEPEEGEDVVRAFLDSRPDFRVGDARPALPEPARVFVGADGFLRTSPADADLDGFFAALLVRAGGAER